MSIDYGKPIAGIDANSLYIDRFKEWTKSPLVDHPEIAKNVAAASSKLINEESGPKKNKFNLGKSIVKGIAGIGNAIGNAAIETGLWTDTSPDKKIITKDEDGKTHIDYKLAFTNLGTNTLRGAAYASTFLKDSDKTADNVNNLAVTSARKTALQTAMSSGSIPGLIYGTLGRLSDAGGFTVSGSKTGNFLTDVANGAASFVPFLGLLGGNAGTMNTYANIDASSTYGNIYDVYGAREHSKGNFIAGLGGIRNAIKDTNTKSYIISNSILDPGRRDLASAMDNRWGVAANFELAGGYNQVGRAKQGAVLQFSKKTISRYKFKNGGITKVKQKANGDSEIYLEKDPSSYEEWVKDIPKEYYDNYDLKLAYESLPKDELNAWKFAVTSDNPDFYMDILWPVLDENGNPIYNDNGEIEKYYPYHLGSVAEEKDKDGKWTGNYVFLKLGKETENPEIQGELNFFKTGKGKDVNENNYNLFFNEEENRYYYLLKNKKLLEKYKEGGKVNVIPEGALHKNKHHLTDIDDKFKDVTTKGIPVIVESEGGDLVLLAEVERQEIIFRLEVTKKLEELSKKKTDEAAIEAGKLLVKEILYNTIDNTQEMI